MGSFRGMRRRCATCFFVHPAHQHRSGPFRPTQHREPQFWLNCEEPELRGYMINVGDKITSRIDNPQGPFGCILALALIADRFRLCTDDEFDSFS